VGNAASVAKQLDAAVAAFHRRPLQDIYRVLVIDFRLAQAESAAQWEQSLGDLVRRGLHGEHLEMLCVDGGAGLRRSACPG
jgi:transposase-like protein